MGIILQLCVYILQLNFATSQPSLSISIVCHQFEIIQAQGLHRMFNWGMYELLERFEKQETERGEKPEKEKSGVKVRHCINEDADEGGECTSISRSQQGISFHPPHQLCK